MLDIKWIRENPEKFDVAMGYRNNAVKAVDILQIDEEKRKQTFLIQELQAKRNNFAKEIA
ncbi:MAG: serine--tRNA ligase, partial [Rickettsiales bacterium]|nr:serine--tRNA ligase [Rickettsiales bacterium]